MAFFFQDYAFALVSRMKVPRFILIVDEISTWSGKIFAWLIGVLTLVVSIEVFKRYILNAPTAWIFDADAFLYGTLFMMCGAYTLAQNGHVRGDFLYTNMKPRTQAWLDLALYFLFFLPGIVALVYAGYYYAADSIRIDEHSNVTAEGPPVWPFKCVIPMAGVLVLAQGISEIIRCIICIRTGAWPERGCPTPPWPAWPGGDCPARRADSRPCAMPRFVASR